MVSLGVAIFSPCVLGLLWGEWPLAGSLSSSLSIRLSALRLRFSPTSRKRRPGTTLRPQPKQNLKKLRRKQPPSHTFVVCMQCPTCSTVSRTYNRTVQLHKEPLPRKSKWATYLATLLMLPVPGNRATLRSGQCETPVHRVWVWLYWHSQGKFILGVSEGVY